MNYSTSPDDDAEIKILSQNMEKLKDRQCWWDDVASVPQVKNKRLFHLVLRNLMWKFHRLATLFTKNFVTSQVL